MQEVLRCPKCHSSQTRARLKTGDRFCNICGNIWKIEDTEVEDDRS